MTLTTPGSHLDALRNTAPLVHCITNYVAMNISANVLLAAGASPAMVHATEEAGEFAAFAHVLSINIGTISPAWVEGMLASVNGAKAAGKPWVLDPVAHSATGFRRESVAKLMALKPTVIRGNASEILALAGMSAGGRGVDTTDTAASAVPAAQALARQINTIVVVTGEVDYITDGQRTRTVTGGDPLMTRVVGTGCALSAVVAASCSLPGDRLDNIAAACGWMKRAGTVAVAQSRGPGSFASAFLDALYTLEEQA